MAAEKNFENKVKRYLESIGVYDLGTGADKMKVAPCGYYEKRWGGGYSKAGLPDTRTVTTNFVRYRVKHQQSASPLVLQEPMPKITAAVMNNLHSISCCSDSAPMS